MRPPQGTTTPRELAASEASPSPLEGAARQRLEEIFPFTRYAYFNVVGPRCSAYDSWVAVLGHEAV